MNDEDLTVLEASQAAELFIEDRLLNHPHIKSHFSESQAIHALRELAKLLDDRFDDPDDAVFVYQTMVEIYKDSRNAISEGKNSRSL